MRRNIQVEIMRLLMEIDHDPYLTEIAKKLGVPSSHVYYHVKQLVEKGILLKREEEGMIVYQPQPFFGPKNLAIVEMALKGMATKTGNSEKVLSNCLKLYWELLK